MVVQNFTQKDEDLAVFAKALSHPTRVAILKFLASLDCCYFGAINDELTISKATVSQHLKELKSAGLIEGTIEYPKIKYCINPEKWNEAKKIFEQFFDLGIQANNDCHQTKNEE